jgi:nickel-dependent lactate racemase
MKVQFEYGQGFMEAELPDDRTDVFVPGETVADPDFIPFDEIVEKTRDSILNPIGMEPISKLAKAGSKVVVIFPDRVKGGEHESAHRRISIPIIIEECKKAGVDEKDILLICSNGLHRKNTKVEIKRILGDEIFDRYWWSGQIKNHDSEDYDNLVDLGVDEQNNPVIMSKDVFEADLAVCVGHTLGNPYGGYSGGYKHSATGITHWKSIASHHVPDVMHRADFTPVSCKSLMRSKFDSISMYMEEKMGKKFFMCDAVLDTKARQIGVFSGYAAEMQPVSWQLADQRTNVPYAKEKYDVMIFGMPQAFHYGNGMGTNPIFMMQAASAQIIRHKRVMSDNCVMIFASICNGYFHDEEFPSYRETYELFQKDYHNQLPDMAEHGEYFAEMKHYTDAYRFNYAYHPYHAFSMMSCGHLAEKHTSAVYCVGGYEPGYARGMGMKSRASFAEALKDAEKYVGTNPKILALPRTFRTAAVHLHMAE